jgi:hypothetical protein
MQKVLNALAVCLLVGCFGSRQAAAASRIPCVAQGATAGWKTYIDRKHGFCLLYPPIYKRVSNTIRQEDIVTLSRSDLEASIYIAFEDKAFNLQSFVERAPTGYDSPPDPVRAGPSTFYYYGPGGGGVSYADQYFFYLKGKTLYISFDGPYVNDKTPSPETKALEPKLLSSLRTF